MKIVKPPAQTGGFVVDLKTIINLFFNIYCGRNKIVFANIFS